MTQNVWFSATSLEEFDLQRMAPGQPRKWRLLAAACCQRAVILVAEGRLDRIVRAAEEFADEMLTWDELKKARRVLAGIRKEIGEDYVGPQEALRITADALDDATHKHASVTLGAVGKVPFAFAAGSRGQPHAQTKMDRLYKVELKQQLRLARDIFGNPFRSTTFDPAWRTSESISIAGRMYDSRDFSAMPILADALEETGCTNLDVLLHCREPGVHVRGCWVVDLVLGKS